MKIKPAEEINLVYGVVEHTYNSLYDGETVLRLMWLKYIWNTSYLNCGCTWKWRMIIAVNFKFQQLERRSLKKKARLQWDSNPWPRQYRIFFPGFFFHNCWNWKFTAMIILRLHFLWCCAWFSWDLQHFSKGLDTKCEGIRWYFTDDQPVIWANDTIN